MHLDHPQPKTPYDKLEKNVVVAGDTANGLLGLKFLNKLKRKGFIVFACDGNHEHYSNLGKGRDALETEDRFRKDFPIWDKLDDKPIVLVNGWYRVSNESKWQNYMNDSKMSDLNAERVNQFAINDAKTVEYQLEQWRQKRVSGIVVTHTAPCEETLDPNFKGHYSNEWYWNPYMRDLIEKFPSEIDVWCHGHTHKRNEAKVSGVKVVCNPRGYPGENPFWEPLTVEI